MGPGRFRTLYDLPILTTVAGDEGPAPTWRRAPLWAYLALTAAGLALGLWTALGPTLSAALLVTLNVAVAMSLAVGVGWHRPAHARGWLVLAGAQCCSSAAFASWCLIPALTGHQAPEPSPADGLFLVAYAGNALGVGLLSRNRPGADRRNSIVDGLIATTGLTVLSWVFLIQPLVRDSELSLGLKLLSAAYPALDLLLVMLILRLAFGDPAPTPAKVLLLTWGCLQLAGDTAYLALVLAGRWTMSSPVFLVWMGAFGCLLAAGLHPTMKTLGQSPAGAASRANRVRQTVVGATVLILPVLLIVRVIQEKSGDLPVITAAAIVVFVLVLFRSGLPRDRRATRSDRIALLRLVAGFAGCLLLPLVLMAESSIHLTEKIVVEDVQDQMSTSSRVSAQLIQEQMEGVEHLVGAYAERRLLSQALGDGTVGSFDTGSARRHLRQLRAAIPGAVGAFVTDADGRVGAVIPRTPAMVETDFSTRDWFHEALRTGRPAISSAYTTTIAGQTQVVSAAAPVMQVNTSTVLGVLVVAYDLRAIQDLSDDLGRAQGVRLLITDQRGVVVATPDRDVKPLSDAAGDVGVSRALQGTQGLDTITDGSGEKILSAYAPVAGLGWTVTAQLPTATAYAPLKHLRSTILAVAVLLGQVLLGGLVLMIRTQRQRRDTERTLLEREAGTSAILDAAADAFVSIDEQSVVVSWSRQAELLFGWSAAEALGSSLDQLIIPPTMRADHVAGVQRLIHTGVPTILGQRIEVSAIHRDGHEFPIELATWQSETDGKQTFNAFIHDISDRKQHESQLAAARDEALENSRLKTEFLAVMSHELRTPMNGVMGMTSLLLGTPLSAQQREYAETVRSSAESLLELLNDILDLSKVEADRLELEVLDFDLQQLVRDVVHLLRIAAEQKGISLTATLADDVRTALCGDPGRLRQVLINLVGNAVKFTAQGSVHLQVSTDDSPSADDQAAEQVALRFDITDTGIGISPEAQSQVFESFSQADASTTRQYGGTGLGLAISRRLVSLFGGEIGVESEPGVGSTFWFTARFRPGTPMIASDQPGTESVDAPPSLVLVVDDNATNQKIAVRMLETLGHRADVAGDGAEAVSAWASVPYDLILMDCRMPVMDGFEATRSIRAAESSGRRTPILAMTASAMVDNRERCLEAGMDDFLSKPVQLNHLRDRVNHWLTRNATGAGPGPAAPVTPPDDQDRTPVLDPDIIAELTSFGQEFIVSLMQEFVESLPGRLSEIRAALEEGDPPRLARAAHVLRGSAANMGAARLARVCGELEETSQGGDLAGAPALTGLLDTEAERLLAAAETLIGVAP